MLKIKELLTKILQNLNTLNSKITTVTINSGFTYKGTKANEWEYVGKSFTVPANHRYIVTLYQNHSSGTPLGLGVGTSSSDTNPVYTMRGDYVKQVTWTLAPGTYYIYTFRSTVPSSNNTYSAYALSISF